MRQHFRRPSDCRKQFVLSGHKPLEELRRIAVQRISGKELRESFRAGDADGKQTPIRVFADGGVVVRSAVNADFIQIGLPDFSIRVRQNPARHISHPDRGYLAERRQHPLRRHVCRFPLQDFQHPRRLRGLEGNPPFEGAEAGGNGYGVSVSGICFISAEGIRIRLGNCPVERRLDDIEQFRVLEPDVTRQQRCV